MLFVERKPIPDGEPCEHSGCLRHVSHPCEGCGRIAGYTLPELPEMWWQYFAQLEERVRELEDTLGTVKHTTVKTIPYYERIVILKKLLAAKGE